MSRPFACPARLINAFAACLVVGILAAFWVRCWGSGFNAGSKRQDNVAPSSTSYGNSVEVREGPICINPAKRQLIPVSGDDLQWLEQLIQPLPAERINVSDVLHILRVHGLNGVLVGDTYSRGRELLELLCHDEASASVFGNPAIVSTRYGARFPTFVPDIQSLAPWMEVHRDQCLAVLGELGIPLSCNLVVNGEQKSLREVLNDSIANFYIGQQELEWTAVAYGCYLPPVRSWQNRYGELTTFDDLARVLLDRSLGESTCAGTHRLLALTILLRIDREHASIFTPHVRDEILAWLKECLGFASRARSADGSWNLSWHPNSLKVESGLWTPAHDGGTARLLATGHLVEWMLYLPDDLKVPDEMIRDAGVWCLGQLKGATQKQIEGAFCPYSHCAIVLRQLVFADSEKHFREQTQL